MKGKLYCDGASRGNPGEAGIGCVIFYDGERREISEYIGIATNNTAEYNALIRGLEEALSLGIDEIEVYSDSELLIRQLKGVYKVRNQGLLPLYEKVLELLRKFKKYQLNHIGREENRLADSLAKEASWSSKK